MCRHVSFVLAAVCAVFLCAAAASGDAPKPNLLLITVDDMNTDSVGAFGSAVPDSTPSIDQLAKEGLRFERAHVQVANCMPSRNVMWSGRYPRSNKIEGFYQVKHPGYLTLADYAKSAGYFTAIRHKAHDSTPYTPYDWDAVLDTIAGGEKQHKKDPASYGLSTAEGIRLAKRAGKPFCLLINIADPHLPFFGLNRKGKAIADPFVPSRIYRAEEVAVPGFLVDDPVVRQELAHYYSSVRRADDAVGQVLRALQESGEADNTLVMFLSDHGMPFPFAKTQLYHHSTSTPLIVRWPDVIKPNSVEGEHLVSAVDILPTLLDAIGEAVPQDLDGRTFLPLLQGGTQDGRDYVFKVYNENAAGAREPMVAVESAQFLYIFNPWSNGKRTLFSATYDTDTYKRMLQLAEKDARIADRLQLLNHRVLEEFYDVQSDPDCLVNLIDDPAYQEQVDEYRELLEQWLRNMQDPMLEVLLQRDDPATLAAFMLEQKRLTRERKQWSRAILEQRKASGS